MNKEDGRLKPADPQEIADVKSVGKIFECPLCGFKQARYKIEFSEQPRCPNCKTGLMMEQLPW